MEYKRCYFVLPNNCSHLTFLKKSCSLVRWFSTKLHNSKSLWSICVTFSGILCLVLENTCGKFRCKQTSMRKVIALAFIYVNPHPVYSIEWRIYASFRNLCIWTYDLYMRQSAPKVLIKGNQMKCVWWNNSVYDGIERTWKMKRKSSFWQIWITLARPIFRPMFGSWTIRWEPLS